MGASRTSRKKTGTASTEQDEQSSRCSPQAADDEPPHAQVRKPGNMMSKSDAPAVRQRPANRTASPRKPAAKSTSKDTTNPARKPIYSFFNAATQRQQSAQPTAPAKSSLPAEKIPIIQEQVEAIRDESDVEDSHGSTTQTALSKESSVALAMRKRKFQRSQSFENDSSSQPPSGSQKFIKVGSGERVPSFSSRNEDKRPWTEQFAPLNLSELAVHKRKVGDVRQWLQSALQGRRQKVLVLKGAAGTGKTTTLSLLARDLGIELVEWKDTTSDNSAVDDRTTAAARFEEFITRAGKTSGLQLSTNVSAELPPINHSTAIGGGPVDRPQAVLIEEFPNTFSRTSNTLQSFRSAISQYVSTVTNGARPTPLIMVISETLLSTSTASADSFTAHRLLGPELMTNPFVNIIEFNSVAPTFLTKALELIVLKEARKSGRKKTPGPLVLKQISETGDIRSAVSALEFLCLRGDEGDTWSSKIAFTKPKHSKAPPTLTKSEKEALKLINHRESTLGIFHSVGKVVYNKRSDPADLASVAHPPTWLPQLRRPKLPDVDTDLLIDEMGTDTQTFLAALHENYALSCSSSSSEETLDSLSGCINSLSDSELLSFDRVSFGTRAFSGSATDGLRQDEMCFQVAVRGLLFNLPHPVNRVAPAHGKPADAFRMFYPASLKLWRRTEEVEARLELLLGKLVTGQYTSTAKSESSSGTGVESWKRNTPVTAPTSTPDPLQMHRELRTEMLLDRLPYMAQILGVRKPLGTSGHVLDDVAYITRVSSTATSPGDDALDGDMDDDGTFDANPEQWSTDRPDAGLEMKVAAVGKSKPDGTSVGVKRPGLPVESRIEHLVLEDDDIVDD